MQVDGKKNCEEANQRNIHLEQKIESLVRTNEQLNHRLDKISNTKNVSCQTDNDTIMIKTKKGLTYTLSENTLYTHEGKVAGNVVM